MAQWMVFSDTDSFPGHDAGKQYNSDFEACKRMAELYNFTGFIHRRGEVIFRNIPAEQLVSRKVPSRGTTLFCRVPMGTAMAMPQAVASAVPQAGWQGQQRPPSPPPGQQRPWEQPSTYGQQRPWEQPGPQGQQRPWQQPSPGMTQTYMGQKMPGQMMPGQQMPGQQYSPRQQSQPTMPGQQMAGQPMPGQYMMPGQQMPGQQASPRQQRQPEMSGPEFHHMLIAPKAFPALKQAPDDQMDMMNVNPQLLDDWIVTLPDVKAIEDRIGKVLEERAQLAEQILAKESEFSEVKAQCEASVEDTSARVSAIQALCEQRAEILAQRSPEQVAEMFTGLANEADEAAEQALCDALEAPDELDNAALRDLRSKYVDGKAEKHAKLAVAEYLRAQSAAA